MNKELGIKDWLIILLLIAIPIVNIIILLVWAFGEKNNKTNFARAYLIFAGICIAIGIFFTIITIMFALLAVV